MLTALIKTVPPKIVSYKPKNPFMAKVLAINPLSDSDKAEQVMHLLLSLNDSQINYAAGQCVGVIPLVKNHNNSSVKARLYSIASATNGDKGFSNTLCLTVKRVKYIDEFNQVQYGICSNYLCDLKVDDEVALISPTGRTMLLPDDKNCNLILIATGTGVAPFRAFLKQIDNLDSPWLGKVHLYLGYRTKNDALYCNHLNQEILDLCQKHNFNLSLALSREEKNPNGGKIYVDQRLTEDIQSIKKIISSNNFAVYICGLKNMEKLVEDFFKPLLEHINPNWQELKKELRNLGRWNVEVY